mmetsp:Transcript_5883/g.24767  ORF Transcript_5883/g.24767 Transcript_5883/m.24767 type:complete len:387 (+) Transcript_5883:619-1779(+)
MPPASGTPAMRQPQAGLARVAASQRLCLQPELACTPAATQLHRATSGSQPAPPRPRASPAFARRAQGTPASSLPAPCPSLTRLPMRPPLAPESRPPSSRSPPWRAQPHRRPEGSPPRLATTLFAFVTDSQRGRPARSAPPTPLGWRLLAPPRPSPRRCRRLPPPALPPWLRRSRPRPRMRPLKRTKASPRASPRCAPVTARSRRGGLRRRHPRWTRTRTAARRSVPMTRRPRPSCPRLELAAALRGPKVRPFSLDTPPLLPFRRRQRRLRANQRRLLSAESPRRRHSPRSRPRCPRRPPKPAPVCAGEHQPFPVQGQPPRATSPALPRLAAGAPAPAPALPALSLRWKRRNSRASVPSSTVSGCRRALMCPCLGRASPCSRRGGGR